jgi:hypothetical protein
MLQVVSVVPDALPLNDSVPWSTLQWEISRIQQMEVCGTVPYVWPSELWGSSLKFRPDIYIYIHTYIYINIGLRYVRYL